MSSCRHSPFVPQVHPATGYSIARSLREAPGLAADLADILAKDLTVGQTAEAAWHALWPAEKRRQVLQAQP
jgi:lycopene epsilon-cyclase